MQFIIILVLIILGIQCSIKNPQMPSWILPINIPLEKYEFTMEDLIQDSTFFEKDSLNSSMMINIKGDIDRQEIKESDLTVNKFDSTAVFQLDTVVVDSFDVILAPQNDLSLGNLYPSLQNYVGQKIIIPSAQIQNYQIQVHTGEFESIHAYSGRVVLTITNHLPVAIQANSAIDILSSSSPQTLDTNLVTFVLPQDLQPGASIQLEQNFTNKWLVNPLHYNLNITTLQSQDSVLITDSLLANSFIDASLQLYDVHADKALAQLNAHEYSWKDKVAVNDSNTIYYGKVASGSLHLEVTNSLPIGGSIRIKFMNIRNENNSPFSQTVYIKPAGISNIDINLAGLKVVGVDKFGNVDLSHNTPVDSIIYQVFVTNDATDSLVFIDATSNIQVHLYTSNIVFQSFEGELAPRTITFNPIEKNNIADYQQYDGKIEFKNLKLLIHLYNEMDIENVEFELHLEAYHKENGVITQTKLISPLLTGTLTPGSADNPSLNVFEITGPEIEDLVNILPTDIKVWGSAIVGGKVVVSAGQGIYGDYQFVSPMELRIPNPIIVDSDEKRIEESDIGQDGVQKIKEGRIESATIDVQINNSLPVGGVFYLIVDSVYAGQPQLDTTNAALAIKLDQFLPAPVGQDGVVTQSVQTHQTIELSREQIQLFGNPPLRWKFLVKLNPTDSTVNNGYVKFLIDNGMSAEGEIGINLKVDEDI